VYLKASNPPVNGSSFVPAGSLHGTSPKMMDLSHFFSPCILLSISDMMDRFGKHLISLENLSIIL
jgi:hypothetical protein